MSTQPADDETWQLSGSVSLRPEPFGALAYDFSTRQLSFLKSPKLVNVVRRLGTSPSVGHAMTDAGVAPAEWPAYRAALKGLAGTGIIKERTS